MPPEVLSNEDIKSSPSIDVWALGVMMYQLFTGKLPFKGSRTSEIKRSILED
jgi:eukaryotic-like serine/threonine-protein kinase